MKTELKIDPLLYEKELWRQGFNHVAGIDEVGRGPLAGPVYACAVMFNKTYFHHEVRDSKKIADKKRSALAQILCSKATTWAIGEASVAEIDRLNIRQATFLAMRRALGGLDIQADYVLVDGEHIPDIALPMTALIKGDERSFTIAAASIIAKVNRDAYMVQLNDVYPHYGFERNKGYGTAEHIRALGMYGLSPYHRKSFLGKIRNRL
jgi:ribonuclease HII